MQRTLQGRSDLLLWRDDSRTYLCCKYKRKIIERKYISLSPDQLVQLGGSDLGTAATRRPRCLVPNRKLKIFALNRADTSSCRSRRKSGIGSFMFSSEGNHIVLETFISLPFLFLFDIFQYSHRLPPPGVDQAIACSSGSVTSIRTTPTRM